MNEELNKKLAEWAGFKLRHTGIKDEIPVWLEPDDNYAPDNPTAYFFGGKNYGLPDFTSSLDACFKWLVPKMENVGGRRLEEIHLYPTSRGNYLCELDMVQIEDRRSPECEVKWAAAETSALALCLAIEKLIDAEESR